MSGGAERVSRAYLNALSERGHQVFWFANDFAGAVPEETMGGITIVRGGGRGTSIRKAIQWYRRQPAFDLVIDQHHGIPWYAPWWARTKCVAYIHEVLGPIWDAFYQWPLSTIGRTQERWTHWLYRDVPFWTPSESTRQALESHGVRRVKVLPNGTDTAPLADLPSKPLAQPLRLAAVSRLAPNKRVEHAIEAARLLARKGVEVVLTIVGGGEEEGQLKDLARRGALTEKVRFAGQLPEAGKNAELSGAHFLVHTSLREGWGLNVIEANALGTPAIVYPVGGLVDSTINGETGIITAAETPAALAESVLSLLQKPEQYKRLRLNAWNRAKTFQWSKVLPPACDWLEEQASLDSRLDNPGSAR